MKSKFRKLPTIILTFFIIMAFTFTIFDSTAFARGSGTKSTSSRRTSSPSKATPSSGAKSGSFSNTTKTPKSSATSGSFSNSPKSSTNNSSVTNIYGGSGSSWHLPTIIFWPHRSYYYDSYGVSHYGYRAPSLLGILGDIITLIIVISIIMWFIKRRR